MVDTGSWVSENSSSETVRKVSDASAMYPFGSPKGYYFSPFWPPYTDQIHGRSVARTPFRTVSLGDSVNRGNRPPSLRKLCFGKILELSYRSRLSGFLCRPAFRQKLSEALFM